MACYVDDICVATGNESLYKQFYSTLSGHFNVEEKGKLDWFLGMEVVQHDNGNIELNQSKYIGDMLNRFVPTRGGPSMSGRCGEGAYRLVCTGAPTP